MQHMFIEYDYKTPLWVPLKIILMKLLLMTGNYRKLVGRKEYFDVQNGNHKEISQLIFPSLDDDFYMVMIPC